MIFDILKRQRGKCSDICNIKKAKMESTVSVVILKKQTESTVSAVIEAKRSKSCHIKKAKRESAVNVVILKGQSCVIILKRQRGKTQ